MKIFILAGIVILGLIILVEISLRGIFGLGNPVLYLPDAEIGYLLAPNQQLRRMGNQIRINQYSMRSEPIDSQRPENTLRILLIGDSIANGAWWTDQRQTISALIEQSLQEHNNDKVQVLNASANSWGPRNQIAYLKRFGTFESQIIIQLLNTDDLFATVPTSLPVGRDRNCPNRKPLLALTEVFTQFILPPKPIPELAEIMQKKEDRVGMNLKAIQDLKNLANQNNAQFIVAMTPLLREIDPATQRDYEKEARTRLKTFLESEGISYINFLPIFQKVQHPKLLYRDTIHLTPRGNQQVSETLTQSVRNLKSHI